ncbi:MAG: hypothetical protein ACRDTE_19835 [Pseudonocardiaceae bacterium]
MAGDGEAVGDAHQHVAVLDDAAMADRVDLGFVGAGAAPDLPVGDPGLGVDRVEDGSELVGGQCYAQVVPFV